MGKKQRKTTLGICAYCGKETTLTEDHVVPRCLFGAAGKTPPDVPIVGACQLCNQQQKSLDDMYLRDMLVRDGDAASNVIAQHIRLGPALRAAQTGKATRDATSGKLFERRGAAGLVLLQPQQPPERLRRTLTQLVRGLSQAYAGYVVPQETPFDVLRFPSPLFEAEIQQWRQSGQRHVVGDGKVFWCYVVRSLEQPGLNLWFLCFYERVTFLVLANFSNLSLVV